MSNFQAGLRVAHVLIQGIPQTTETVGVLTQAVREYVRERLTEEHFESLDPAGVEKAHRERNQALVLLGLMEDDPRTSLAYAVATDATFGHDVALLINSHMISDQLRTALIDVIDEAIIQNAIIQGLYSDDDNNDEVQFAIARIQMFLDMLKSLGVTVPDEYQYVKGLLNE